MNSDTVTERLKGTERSERDWLVVCTKCTLLECQLVVEIAQDRLGYSRVKLSFDFSLYDNHNKKFSKDNGLAEVESEILPQIIRAKKETLLMIRYERIQVFGL